jgi:RNA polymerase sigma-70 factor (ECF subfamily)
MDEADRPRGEVTMLLAAVRDGDAGAKDRLFEVVYAELRRRAAALMARQPARHTLQPTALVHEAYLRLSGGEGEWRDRGHFYATAAAAMRCILVDHARALGAAKRGGGGLRVTLDAESLAGKGGDEEVLAVHDALARLAETDPDQARIVELRYFGGLEFAEIAGALDVPERTVYRRWDRARAWLWRELGP